MSATAAHSLAPRSIACFSNGISSVRETKKNRATRISRKPIVVYVRTFLLIELLLILNAMRRPRNRLQPRRRDRLSAGHALPIRPLRDPFQRVLNLLQRPRFQRDLLQSFAGI